MWQYSKYSNTYKIERIHIHKLKHTFKAKFNLHWYMKRLFVQYNTRLRTRHWSLESKARNKLRVSQDRQQEQDSDFKTTTRNKTREPQDQDREHFKPQCLVTSQDRDSRLENSKTLCLSGIVSHCSICAATKGARTKRKRKKQKLGERWDPAHFGWELTWLTIQNKPPPRMCYHAKFGISATKCVRGAPAQPTFGSSPQFMCISFDAELPNLNTYWPSTHYTVWDVLKPEIRGSRTPKHCACLVLVVLILTMQ